MFPRHSGPNMDESVTGDFLLEFYSPKLHINWITGQSHIQTFSKSKLSILLTLFFLFILFVIFNVRLN